MMVDNQEKRHCEYQRSCLNFSFSSYKCIDSSYAVNIILDDKVVAGNREDICYQKRKEIGRVDGLLNKLMGIDFEEGDK